jgi:hypothetical protein
MSTQRSEEGFNDKIKGHASLKDMLSSDVDHVTPRNHVDTETEQV